MTAVVTLDSDEHVAVVTLNRPDKHNAVNLEMFDVLIDVGRDLAASTSIRAVVLRGAGENFCAGIDTSVFAGEGIGAAGEGRMEPMADSPANFFQRAACIWRELPMPVIAAVHGVAFGAGLQIALGADIRIASESARFSVMEIRWGIIPDMGLSLTARHVVRLDRLKELVYTGRIVDALEAERLGLVTALSADPFMEAHRLAADIATKSPDAVRAGKSLLRDAFDLAPEDALAAEARLQQHLMGSPNQMEAVMANSEKRAPEFADVGGERTR